MAAAGLEVRTEQLPAVTDGKEGRSCFQLDAGGRLQHFTHGGSGWEMRHKCLFDQKIDGFDAAVDSGGTVHLLGYSGGGTLYYRSFPDNNLPTRFHHDGRTITGLSCCAAADAGAEKKLHILYLCRKSSRQRWSLFHGCLGGKDTWEEQAVPECCCLTGTERAYILADSSGSITALCMHLRKKGNRLTARRLEKSTPQAAEAVILEDSPGELFPPSFLAAPDNSVHLSWQSSSGGSRYLNYARRTAAGKWEKRLKLELQLHSLAVAQLHLLRGHLLISWVDGGSLRYLFSQDGGKSWQQGKSGAVEQQPGLARYRSALLPDPAGEHLRGNYIICRGVLPTAASPGGSPAQYGNIAQGGTGDDTFMELNALDTISSYLFYRAEALQASRDDLHKKLAQKEEEAARQYSQALSRAGELEKKLGEKSMQLKEAQSLFQETIGKLQKRLQEERNSFYEEIKKIRACNKRLKNENFSLAQKMTALARKLEALEKEKEDAERKIVELQSSPGSLFGRLFQRFQGR